MCWPSLRKLWLWILGINSPVAFFLTFTRYQDANVIPVLKFVVWYKFILHLTVMFTYSHTYWCAYTWKNKNKPNKRQKWDCVHSAQFNLWDCHHHRLSISVRFLLNSYPNHLVPRTIHDQHATVLIAKIKTHCELTLKIFVMVIQAITVSFFLSINW